MNKIIIIAVIILISAVAVIAQKTQKDFKNKIDSYIDYSVPIITVDELKDQTKDYLILDIRERKEYETSHLCDAVHIGYKNPDFTSLKGIDKSQPIVVYCSIGYRSEKIGVRLLENGFTNVRNLYGSIFEWVNQDQPVYDNNEQVTDKVHTYNRKWSKWMINEEYQKVY